MGVQHVGSKLALAVLSVLSPRDLVAAITHEDVERLVKFGVESPEPSGHVRKARNFRREDFRSHIEMI
jgi:hypothetical protein